MKRLTIATIIAAALLATCGCNAGGGCFRRQADGCGAPLASASGCAGCGEGQVVAAEGSGYVTYEGGLLPPPTTGPLPGPQAITQ